MTVPKQTGQYLDHITSPGERWDILADQYYNDPDLMNLLMAKNKHLFEAYPAILPAGLTLRIPVLETPPLDQTLLPPWKRDQLQ